MDASRRGTPASSGRSGDTVSAGPAHSPRRSTSPQPALDAGTRGAQDAWSPKAGSGTSRSSRAKSERGRRTRRRSSGDKVRHASPKCRECRCGRSIKSTRSQAADRSSHDSGPGERPLSPLQPGVATLPIAKTRSSNSRKAAKKSQKPKGHKKMPQLQQTPLPFSGQSTASAPAALPPFASAASRPSQPQKHPRATKSFVFAEPRTPYFGSSALRTPQQQSTSTSSFVASAPLSKQKQLQKQQQQQQQQQQQPRASQPFVSAALPPSQPLLPLHSEHMVLASVYALVNKHALENAQVAGNVAMLLTMGRVRDQQARAAAQAAPVHGNAHGLGAAPSAPPMPTAGEPGIAPNFQTMCDIPGAKGAQSAQGMPEAADDLARTRFTGYAPPQQTAAAGPPQLDARSIAASAITQATNPGLAHFRVPHATPSFTALTPNLHTPMGFAPPAQLRPVGLPDGPGVHPDAIPARELTRQQPASAGATLELLDDVLNLNS